MCDNVISLPQHRVQLSILSASHFCRPCRPFYSHRAKQQWLAKGMHESEGMVISQLDGKIVKFDVFWSNL